MYSFIQLTVQYKLDNPTNFNNNESDDETQNAVGMMMSRIPLMLEVFGLAANAAEISIFCIRGLELNENLSSELILIT